MKTFCLKGKLDRVCFFKHGSNNIYFYCRELPGLSNTALEVIYILLIYFNYIFS